MKNLIKFLVLFLFVTFINSCTYDDPVEKSQNLKNQETLYTGGDADIEIDDEK